MPSRPVPLPGAGSGATACTGGKHRHACARQRPAAALPRAIQHLDDGLVRAWDRRPDRVACGQSYSGGCRLCWPPRTMHGDRLMRTIRACPAPRTPADEAASAGAATSCRQDACAGLLWHTRAGCAPDAARGKEGWWAHQDSNLEPRDYEALKSGFQRVL